MANNLCLWKAWQGIVSRAMWTGSAQIVWKWLWKTNQMGNLMKHYFWKASLHSVGFNFIDTSLYLQSHPIHEPLKDNLLGIPNLPAMFSWNLSHNTPWGTVSTLKNCLKLGWDIAQLVFFFYAGSPEFAAQCRKAGHGAAQLQSWFWCILACRKWRYWGLKLNVMLHRWPK